ncbi:hypothetical protein BALOs_1808 [Halobacteriovorax sp. BALOs_7]|uniref:hypothetical protein n=1 Tax=Halobacteriovorax sp. BALOs_7 TaxID=2109558 RepID=UPI000EA22487|nr:hypothetical protein [Halobacteriovorax sp. BALOs_7]AYF44808.1 hypothetical protein BALOs_1808 [Halobacteriovorax sp. BALOs_7]
MNTKGNAEKNLKTLLLILTFTTFTNLNHAFAQTGQESVQFSNFSVDKYKLESEFSDTDLADISPIYKTIYDNYEANYQSIGDRLSNESNGFFGGVNLVGWRHAGNFHGFKVMFNRSAAPSLFDEDQYLVNDEMVIEISARNFLSALQEKGIIDIAPGVLKSYSNLSLKRTIRYNHFAANATDALQTNFDRLFFMYRYLNPENFDKLSDYDFIKKEDALTFAAGAAATASYQGIGVAAGALASYERKSSVEIQRLGPADNAKENELIRLTAEDSKLISAGANITLMADFLNIVKLTLFRYDFSYSFEKSYKAYMSIYVQDLHDREKLSELKNVTRFGKFNYSKLADNITSYENRKKELKKSKYLAFIIGGVKDSQTESTEVVKDGKVYKFFSHRYERLSYTQNFFTKLLNIVLGQLVGYDQLISNDRVDSKVVDINYESNEELIKSRRDFDIFSSNVYTMTLDQQSKVNKDYKWSKNKTEKKMRGLIRDRTQSYGNFASVFENYTVKAPAEFSSTMTIDNSNMANFLNRNSSEVYDIFKEACGGKSKNFFRRLRSFFSACRHKLYRSYGTFLKEWSVGKYTSEIKRKCERKYRWKYFFRPSKRRRMVAACMEIGSKQLYAKYKHELPLWRFKDIAYNINNHVEKDYLIRRLFGSYSNKGSFSANLNGSIPYKNYYSEGENKENIFTQFQIEQNLRSPASL